MEFNFDFDNDVLNLFNLEMKKDTGDVGSWRITGLELPEGETKTVYMEQLNLTLNSVCVKDIEIESITNISTDCEGESEIKVPCDNQDTDGYSCDLINGFYKITGLKHSGIKQILYDRPSSEEPEESGGSPSSGGGGSGGGGGGGAPPIITSITKVEDEVKETEENLNVQDEIGGEIEGDGDLEAGIEDEESGLGGITGAVTGNPIAKYRPYLITGVIVLVFGILGFQVRRIVKKKEPKKRKLRRQKSNN